MTEQKQIDTPKPLTLDRRPSQKQAKAGAWVEAVAAMTQGNLDAAQEPLPETATRLRRRLHERRQQERQAS